MMQILRLASALILAIAPAVCLGEECQARQVLIQHGAELHLDVATAAEAPPARLSMPTATLASGWLESDSKISSSDTAGVWESNQADASHSSSRDGTDNGNMAKNGPMWLRLHVAAGIILLVAACIVMICRPPSSPPGADRGTRRSASSPDVAGSQSVDPEDSLAAVPCLLASALVPCKDNDKVDDRSRFHPSSSSSTIATSGARSESSANSSERSFQGLLGDQARTPSPAISADAATDDGDSWGSGLTEDAPCLLVGDTANVVESDDEIDAEDEVSDTFEATGVYLTSAATAVNSKQ